ncbi:hypothetical protein EI94DRAFT_510321 [Lactarius quietus]|nr:hypothetical protein EI94DRAFT_510321 [Lactarius quietus]
MVDFHKPAVIEKDFLAAVKLWHVLEGIFIWEFFVSLDYEWSIIRGHRSIYSLTRLNTLMAAVLNMVGIDSSTSINCQVRIISPGFPYAQANLELPFKSYGLSLNLCLATRLSWAVLSEILIVLRIIVIWNRNRMAVVIAICAWNSNVAFFIHNIARVHARWAPTASVCEGLNPETAKITTIGVLIADVSLLLTMLIGLLRLRVHGTMFALGQFLWKRGLIWLFLATISEVPPAVFAGLNLNSKIYFVAILVYSGNQQ